MIYGYKEENLINYPGDLVLRTSSSKIGQQFKEQLENDSEERTPEELEELLNFYKKDLDNTSNLKNIVTMTVIADSLEESVLIAGKVNKRTNDIIDNILEKVLEIFLAENKEFNAEYDENEFENYVSNLEGNVSLKIKINARNSKKEKFTSEVIFRSNGGYDEIIKALPYISSEDYMKRKIANAIEQ